MAKKLLKTKGYVENGEFKTTHVYINKSISQHQNNMALKLKTGYVSLSAEKCKPPCPPDTSTGYYICASENCVFVPFT